MFSAIERVFVRTFRIACGGFVAILAWFPADWALTEFQLPFAQASVASIVAGLFYALVAWLIIVAAWHTAFGEGAKPRPA